MNTTLSCPVCARQGIPEEQSRCPQCDADLTSFQILDSLPDQLEVQVEAENQAKTGKKSGLVVWVLGAMLLLLLGLYALVYLQFGQLESVVEKKHSSYRGDLTRLNTELESLQEVAHEEQQESDAKTGITREQLQKLEAVLQQIETDIATIKEKTTAIKEERQQILSRKKEQAASSSALSGQAEEEFWTYHATDDDTLWGIARKHLGAGEYYPLLLEFNPGLGIYQIDKETTIRIPLHIRNVQERYQRIVEARDGKLFWKYTVLSGDTLQEIARKFYGSAEKTAKVSALNPGAEFKAGTEIRIQLQ